MREGKGSTWPRKQNWKKRKKTQRNTKIFEVCVNCSCYWIAEKSLLPPHSWVAFNITDTFQLTHPIQNKRKRNPQKMFIGKTAMGWPPCFLELKCLCIGRALLKLSMLLKNASCYKTYGSPTKKKPTFYWRHRLTDLLFKYKGTYFKMRILNSHNSYTFRCFMELNNYYFVTHSVG